MTFLGFTWARPCSPRISAVGHSIALAASDLQAMIQRAVRGLRYHQSGSSFGLDISGGSARWYYRLHEPIDFGRRHQVDHYLWSMLTALRLYLGTTWSPVRVEFDCDRPAHWRKLETRFGAPVVFGSPARAIVFESHLLKSPAVLKTPLSDRITFADLRRVASARLAADHPRVYARVDPASSNRATD